MADLKDEEGRITLNMPLDMKVAIQRAANAEDIDMSQWCRTALEKTLHALGISSTWSPYKGRGGRKPKHAN